MSRHDDTAIDWTLIIQPKAKWFDLHLQDLWRYRDLISLFVWRDFVAQYKQTILGPLWFIIQPLLTTIMFTIVFGNIAQLPTDGLPQECEENLFLITTDLDFSDIRRYQPGQHAGILLIRLHKEGKNRVLAY